uniref:Putative alpha/beta-hydrolase n=1 Tax=Cladonia uncialis subsp. uncialis TaxID=180999 RepID=A0A2K9YEN5_CLAUC|nr:putative alpha/beta-hydrolase [Cladonia uncialis subsp. uncialis]
MNSSVRFSIICLLPAFLFFARLASAHPWGSSASHPNNCSINEHPDVTDLNGVNYLRHVHSAHLSSGHNYRYVNYRPYNSSKPSILFLHGFPSSSYDWRRQFDYFASRGYGILAPDLLGYGGSDKPGNVEAYTLKNQANDIAELLDCAGIGDMMSVAHDLGSPLLSRIVTYYPNRSAKYVFLDIGYSAPPLGLNAAGINALNAHSLATEGYEPSGYWAFFNETGAGRVLDAHQDSFWSVIYTDDDPTYWRNVYGPTGALEAFLEADKMAPTGGFVSDKDREIHNRIFAAKQGGYDPCLNQYRALYRNLNLADENAIPHSAAKITKPVLLLTAANDPIGTPARAEAGIRPYAPDLRIQQIDSGHFLMLEKADEVNEAMRGFFES